MLNVPCRSSNPPSIGFRRRGATAADLQFPAHLGIEAATAHKHLLRRVDGERQPDRCGPGADTLAGGGFSPAQRIIQHGDALRQAVRNFDVCLGDADLAADGGQIPGCEFAIRRLRSTFAVAFKRSLAKSSWASRAVTVSDTGRFG